MNTTISDISVMQAGWDALVKQLDVQKATRFVVLLERGEGDSVKERAAYWGDASIDEISQRIADWKARQPK